MRTGLNPFRYQSLLYVGFHVKISKSKHKDSSSGVERDTHLLQFFLLLFNSYKKGASKYHNASGKGHAEHRKPFTRCISSNTCIDAITLSVNKI